MLSRTSIKLASLAAGNTVVQVGNEAFQISLHTTPAQRQNLPQHPAAYLRIIVVCILIPPWNHLKKASEGLSNDDKLCIRSVIGRKEVYDLVGFLEDSTRRYSISIGLHLAYQRQAIDKVLEDLLWIVFIPSRGGVAVAAPFQYIGPAEGLKEHERWVELPL